MQSQSSQKAHKIDNSDDISYQNKKQLIRLITEGAYLRTNPEMEIFFANFRGNNSVSSTEAPIIGKTADPTSQQTN